MLDWTGLPARLTAVRLLPLPPTGVYLKSDQMPHREEDAVDFKSRHKVKTTEWWQLNGGSNRC
jgi:hypothetical protein